MTQTVLVTGASGGVGRAVAQRFRAGGATVLAGYRDPAAVDALVAMGCRPVRLDITSESELADAIGGAADVSADIDIVVNAAGISQGGPMEELPLAALRRQFEVNVLGALRVAQLVAPGMRRRGRGRIVNVSSVAGLVTFPGMGAYAMSKHALESMSQALRQELKPFGIGVSVIQPGGIDTAFAEAERRTFLHGRPEGPYAAFTAEVVDRLSRNPMPLAPDKVARIIVRAATARRPRARYRVGTVAHVMLGLHDLLPDRMWDRLLPVMAPTPEP
ncbi:NAD(P)-dependent dehydrogenase (short-subunit alcohol dehydrogenase family) [Catenulispora sp. EB89]|uniref:SDR family oxidoreductase n=1 Tax=Catenulispora sp. EB89 TaxID=3156257 RepID=UPI003516100C